MRKQDIKPDVVYRNEKSKAIGVLFTGYDYGCLSEDEVGIVYQGDDKNPNTPFFAGTDPSNLEKYALTADNMLTISHIHSTCKPGCGEKCCRYLICSQDGFGCARISGNMSMAHTLDDKVRKDEITAKGINCGGRYGSTKE